MLSKVIACLCVIGLLAGCAAAPEGKAIAKGQRGAARHMDYLSREELIRFIEANYEDELDKQVQLKMVPEGGKLLFIRRPDRDFAFVRAVKGDTVLKICDDKSEIVHSKYKGFNKALGGDAYGTEYSYECGINKKVDGDFNVEVLDRDKKVLRTYRIKLDGGGPEDAPPVYFPREKSGSRS